MAKKDNQPTTDWSINSDIYDIVSNLNELKKNYIDNESETTLALGIYGYITDVEAKKIQTSAIMTGQLGNEMFPLRSQLTRNVLTHSIYCNINNINALPAHMTINLGIKVSDIDTYAYEGKFIIEADSPIFIGDYEFHLDYDIVINRTAINKEKPGDINNPDYSYSAYYDMTEINRISNITEPYLKQPFRIRIGNDYYIIIQCLVRQCTIETINDTIISESIIQNKTFTFDFENQLIDFDVYVNDNGTVTRLTPLLQNSSIEGVEDYCWYLFISENTIRITFDSKSFIPGLNCDIEIRAYTTLGRAGNFTYKSIDNTEDFIYCTLTAENQNYSTITACMVAQTNSVDGQDKKSKRELQTLIPKAAMSRGSLTTETDLDSYFNLIDSEFNRLVLKKKMDNSIKRIWYCYFLLKDENNNIIPTNTLSLNVRIDNGFTTITNDKRYMLPAGSIIKYDRKEMVGEVINETEVPDLYEDDYFNQDYYYYMTVYNLLIDKDPLYAAYYLTVSDRDSFFIFNWINTESELQFVANRCNFQRNLLTDQYMYKFTFGIAQSISENYNMYIEEFESYTDPLTNDIVTEKIVTNNMKCVIVLYKDEIPYRWKEAELTSFDESGYISTWELNLETDNDLDSFNNIKIEDLNVVGSTTDVNYGYFPSNIRVKLYILGKFEEEYGRYELDTLCPGCFEGYTCTNVYEVEDGIFLYENFTNILNTKIEALTEKKFNVDGVPVVGLHYMDSEYNAMQLISALYEKKAYIDYCLILLENNMDIDFKFFNTYGPSVTYSIGDKKETMIGHVDLEMKFRCALKNASDVYTKDELIKYVKEYIEDLYETGDLHIPNLISDVREEFDNKLIYFEYMNFNDFWLGVQHIVLINEDPHVTPEFLNIRNRYNELGELEPCIDIEVNY